MFETIDLNTDSRGVATLLLNRPEKKNAMSAQMIAELHAAAERIDADPGIRVVVLRGAGGLFCAGGDLGWMRAQMEADARTRANEAGKLAAMLGALNCLSKPLIGVIEGAALGGGVGLACICDLSIAAPNTRFGLTETRLGLIPATIGPYVLARMGQGAARQVFMSARIFGAEEAARLGIVSEIAEDPETRLDAEIEAYLACAPGAVAEAKALALKLGGTPDVAQIEASIAALIARWEGDEAAEGIAAFFDKRKVAWMP